ncbi:unnamed protein product, partial [Vitis vinifera]|uniref:Uncharacterized protein n=1 Tax=Vitis vinifera TaxID=29760 RepID=E0CUE1_VITVI
MKKVKNIIANSCQFWDDKTESVEFTFCGCFFWKSFRNLDYGCPDIKPLTTFLNFLMNLSSLILQCRNFGGILRTFLNIL